jgi:hypothetical protein
MLNLTKTIDVNPGTAGTMDARISYPCHKSFDEFIDVARLRSLDGYIIERIERHIAQQTDSYFLNDHPLDESGSHETAVREIWLSRTKPDVPYNYLDLDKPELWEPTVASAEFPLLMDFIATLPFAALGRMLIIYDHIGTAVPAHRDHEYADLCHEFIWLRTNLRKRFYVLNAETNEKEYVESYSAWFDTVNQFHGSDAADGLTFSIRVDGIFTEQFRKQIPWLPANPSATPALWASLSKPNEPISSLNAEAFGRHSIGAGSC